VCQISANLWYYTGISILIERPTVKISLKSIKMKGNETIFFINTLKMIENRGISIFRRFVSFKRT